MKKVKFGILCLMVSFFALLLVACGSAKKDNVEESFMEKVSDVKSYKTSGVLETYYDNNRKQSDFTVYFKANDNYKVILKASDCDEEQIILKNSDGVNILVPSVNKNFKIKSSWPTNASYPYLLQSLAQDIANDSEKIVSENDAQYYIEVKVKLHANANGTKQKIVLSKETNLPEEVVIYDKNGNLFMRCIYTSIELNYNVDDKEFVLEDSMQQARLLYGDDLPTYENRSAQLPGYYPASVKFISKNTISGTSGSRTVMKFSNKEQFMSVICELVDDSEKMENIYENGEVFMVMNTAGLICDGYICYIYEGILYTIATTSVEIEELVKVAASYMINSAK